MVHFPTLYESASTGLLPDTYRHIRDDRELARFALEIAAEHGQMAIISALQHTVLDAARLIACYGAAGGQYKVVNHVLATCGHKNWLNAALAHAIAAGESCMAEYLISLGADVHNERIHAALISAAQDGHLYAVRTALSRGVHLPPNSWVYRLAKENGHLAVAEYIFSQEKRLCPPLPPYCPMYLWLREEGICDMAYWLCLRGKTESAQHCAIQYLLVPSIDRRGTAGTCIMPSQWGLTSYASADDIFREAVRRDHTDAVASLVDAGYEIKAPDMTICSIEMAHLLACATCCHLGTLRYVFEADWIQFVMNREYVLAMRQRVDDPEWWALHEAVVGKIKENHLCLLIAATRLDRADVVAGLYKKEYAQPLLDEAVAGGAMRVLDALLELDSGLASEAFIPAAQNGHVAAVVHLIRAGADPSVAIHFASVPDRLAIVRLLFKRDFTLSDVHVRQMLYVAAYSRDMETVLAILRSSIATIAMDDHHEWSYIKFACRRAGMPLDLWAWVHEQLLDGASRRELLCAAAAYPVAIHKFVVSAIEAFRGAIAPSINELPRNVIITSSSGTHEDRLVAYWNAVYDGRVRAVDYLERYGLHPLPEMERALTIAEEREHVLLAAYLLNKCRSERAPAPKPMPAERPSLQKDYRTALENGNAEALIAAGVDPIKDGRHAMAGAAARGSVPIIMILQDHGVPLSDEAFWGAVAAGHLDVVDYMHSIGYAGKRLPDRDAIMHGHDAVLDYLVGRRDGDSPLVQYMRDGAFEYDLFLNDDGSINLRAYSRTLRSLDHNREPEALRDLVEFGARFRVESCMMLDWAHVAGGDEMVDFVADVLSRD